MSYAILSAFNNVIFWTGTAFFGALALGLVEMKSIDTPEKLTRYLQELEDETSDLYRGRCRDRWEDFAQIFFGKGSTANLLNGFPAASLIWKCHASPVGKEPSDPYYSLKPSNDYYIDPSWRRPLEDLIRDNL